MIVKRLEDIPEFLAGDATKIKEVLHPRDGEVTNPYSLAHARLEPGKSSLPHILKTSSEVYFILNGEGCAYIGDQNVKVSQGDLVFIPPGERQYITNEGQTELHFLCIVSPPWSAEDDQLVE